MKAFIKKADAEQKGYDEKFEIVDVDIKYRSDFVKHFIGEENYPQFISLNEERTFFMGVDEEGLLKQLPFNFLIDVISPSLALERIDAIVGTAVFVRIKKVNPFVEEIWDYEVEDVNADDYIHIMQLLNQKKQVELYAKYKMQYGKDSDF